MRKAYNPVSLRVARRLDTRFADLANLVLGVVLSLITIGGKEVLDQIHAASSLGSAALIIIFYLVRIYFALLMWIAYFRVLEVGRMCPSFRGDWYLAIKTLPLTFALAFASIFGAVPLFAQPLYANLINGGYIAVTLALGLLAAFFFTLHVMARILSSFQTLHADVAREVEANDVFALRQAQATFLGALIPFPAVLYLRYDWWPEALPILMLLILLAVAFVATVSGVRRSNRLRQGHDVAAASL